MGGRGLAESAGGRMVRLRDAQGNHIGMAYVDDETGEGVMMPGMYGLAQNQIPLAKQISSTEASSLVKDALTLGGKNISSADGAQLVQALIASGSLMGKGDLRTKLYRAARLIGDFNAVTGGSQKIVNRIARRLTGRISGKLFRELFK